ncbi:12392_t:CDS:2, partial [Acaulospora colombiana]
PAGVREIGRARCDREETLHNKGKSTPEKNKFSDPFCSMLLNEKRCQVQCILNIAGQHSLKERLRRTTPRRLDFGRKIKSPHVASTKGTLSVPPMMGCFPHESLDQQTYTGS